MQLNDAEQELQNWARYVQDGWLRDHLLYTPPPTSEDYRADIVAFDDPEPASPGIDELAAQRTEAIVVRMGCQNIDAYRVLVHWYPHLQLLRIDGAELSHESSIKSLARQMHTSFRGAQRMLDSARDMYGEWRI